MTDDLHKLSKEELENVSGGFECEGPWDWIKGLEIKCPYCGEESNDIVHYRLATAKSNAHFLCDRCNRMFSYHNHIDRILLIDDHGKGIKTIHL